MAAVAAAVAAMHRKRITRPTSRRPSESLPYDANETYCIFRSVRSGRPLYDTAADGELFVMPPAWDPIVRAIDRGLNVMVTGSRGSGKTSLLRQLQRELRGRDTPVGFVDATAGVSAGKLAERIRDALTGRPAHMSARAYRNPMLVGPLVTFRPKDQPLAPPGEDADPKEYPAGISRVGDKPWR
jgi:hypothetical protein